ncbi:MAG: FtsX-like permease family protein [Dermatophilaceae bacterium]
MTRFRRSAAFAVTEALDSLTERPIRTMVGIIAFAVGAAGLVASLIVGASASAAVRASLTPTQLDTIRLRALDGSLGDAEAGAARDLPRVEAVGVEKLPWEGPQTIGLLSSAAGYLIQASASVVSADSDYLAAVRAVVRQKTAASQLDSTWSSGVALLGVQTAKDLGISGAGPGVKIWIGNAGFDVAGLIERADRDPSLANSVVISPSGLRRLANTDKIQTEMVVITASGSAGPVSLALPSVLRPTNPAQVRISDVLDLRAIRDGVSTVISRVLAWTGLVIALLAAAIVGATNYISVLGRRGEIGLRRCLGASRVVVGSIFVLEGSLVGLAGGVAGSALGSILGFLTDRTQLWPAVFAPWFFVAGPVVGVSAGTLACLWPAWRAARVAPASAMRME